MREFRAINGVPDFDCTLLREKSSDYALLIPIINEGQRIKAELQRAKDAGIDKICDIILCDGGSTDGSTDPEALSAMGVAALLVKRGPGKQGAQLRTGIYHALEAGYEGILTVDGNNKDSIESVPLFIEKLREGYDFIQGSRFIEGGVAVNAVPGEAWALLRDDGSPAFASLIAAATLLPDDTPHMRPSLRARSHAVCSASSSLTMQMSL